MIKIQLTEQERKVYDLIINEGTMEDMFELGYSLGRARQAQEQLDKLRLLHHVLFYRDTRNA